MHYACPTCHNALSIAPNKNGQQYECNDCKTVFPEIANVPLLWSRPNEALLDWRNKLNLTLSETEEQISKLQIALNKPVPIDATKQRLHHLHAHYCSYLEQLRRLFAPFKPGEPLARELHNALGTAILSHHGALSYAPQIFRGWAWQNGSASENQSVLNYLVSKLAEFTTTQSRVLVLGCGAGRLVYDLALHLQPEEVVGLDANPVLTHIAQQLVDGKGFELIEFPIAPITPADFAVNHTLSAPTQSTKLNLQFVCADALNPPFAANQFDIVITPWLVDVIDAPLTAVMQSVAAVLKTDGIWLCHGSLAFSGDVLNRLDHAEVVELTGQNGFDVLSWENQWLPYLQSPHSRNHRQEQVFTQVAQLTQALGFAKQPTRSVPKWITDPNQPVPLLPQFQTQLTSTRIHAFIMGLVDGKRDVNAMAEVLEQQRLMPKTQAKQAIQGFLKKMYEEAKTASGHGA